MNTGNYLLQTMAAISARPDLAFFIELALKSTVVVLLTLMPALLLRRSAAAHQHLLWSLCILTLSCLPVFLGLLPALPITITTVAGEGMEAPAEAGGVFATASIALWWPPLLKLYLAGLGLLLTWTLCGLARMLVLSRQARQTSNAEALQLLRGILDEELVELRISLREHRALKSPLSWGLINPQIILPVESQQWSREKLRHVLLHELHHILRLDWLSHLAGCYVRAVYWYNPLIWYATRNMHRLSEEACDDAVLLAHSSHTAYASDLVAVARASSDSKARHLAQALATSFLGSRIVAILDTSRIRRRNDSVWVIRGSLIAFSLVAALASLTLAPAPSLDGVRAGFTRFVTINLLPRQTATSDPEQMIVNPLPRRMTLSSNLPPLETIYIQDRMPAINELSASPSALRPVVELQEVVAPQENNAVHVLQKSFPEYPSAAQRQGIEGYITIEYDITADGRVINPLVIESRPRRTFDASAMKAIRNYRIEPPKVNGLPVGIKGLRTRFVYELDPDPG